MEDKDLIENLNERIKELTCLYEISNIASDYKLSLDDMLQSIVQFIPKAWKFSEDAIAEINIDSKFFMSDNLPLKHISQKHVIKINQEERGYLAVYYSAEEHIKSDFLKEEQVLLKTLAQELGSIIDRSEQKIREELIQRKIQHSDRISILGEITAGIAHELNTPLGNILGFSQLIQDKTTDLQIQRDINKIIDSAIYSREIVKKLMFFSCEMPQHMQKISITKLIDEALDLLKMSVKEAGLQVIFKKNKSIIEAQVDPVQFTQIVFNLLINAIHASSPGQNIIVDLSKDNTDLTLTIQDYGHGIKAELKEKVFEPFFTTKSTGQGSGLGLSVVHGIVKSHGGEIKVDSEENRGSIFEIKLPLHQS